MRSATISIPCRNEKKYIGRCLDSLLKLELPDIELEVFVCDGMSEDGTREIVLEYSDRYPHIRLLDNVRRTTPYALNLGAKAGKGEIVIILGAHSEVEPGYVRAAFEELDARSDVGCVGGFVENAFEDETSRLVSVATSSPFGVGNAHYRTGHKGGYVDTVLFGAYRRSVLDEIGYFDEALTRNQDDEINYRLLKAGYRIYLSETIRSRYYVRSSYSKLWKQYFQYGYWKVFVNKKHRAVTTARQLAPLALVLFLLGGASASLCWPWARLPFGAGIGVYLAAALAAALAKTRSFQVFPVALIFLVLHLSYGLGYLEGLIHFVLLDRRPVSKHATLSR